MHMYETLMEEYEAWPLSQVIVCVCVCVCIYMYVYMHTYEALIEDYEALPVSPHRLEAQGLID